MKIKAINSTTLKSLANKIIAHLNIENPRVSEKLKKFVTIAWRHKNYHCYIDYDREIIALAIIVVSSKGYNFIYNAKTKFSRDMNKLNDFKEIL